MDLTSALVTWDPPFPPNQTVGYQVYYTGPTNGSVTADVFGAQTGSTTVTGLLNGGVYSFSVAGKSAHFDSERVASQYGSVYLCKHLKCIHAKISCISMLYSFIPYCLVEGGPQLLNVRVLHKVFTA